MTHGYLIRSRKIVKVGNKTTKEIWTVRTRSKFKDHYQDVNLFIEIISNN